MKNSKRLSKKIVAMAIAVTMAMVFGMMVVMNGVLESAWADDEYNFPYKPLDVEFYKTMYPDVVAAVGDDPFDLWMHYWDHGMAEGRIPYPGAEPGVFVDGYKESDEAEAARAAAWEAEKAKRAQAEAAERAQSIAAAQVGVGEYVYDYSAVYDLSDWTPEQMAMLAQKQLEFDASGLIRIGSTEEQVYDKLIWIRDNLYPENSYGSICEIGAGRIAAALYGYDPDWFFEDEQGLLLCDKDGMRVTPIGFARLESVQRANGGNIRDIRVGDMLFTYGAYGAGHVQVVLAHDDKGITVAESNVNEDEKFHWGGRISWDELENGGKTIYQQSNKWSEYVHYY